MSDVADFSSFKLSCIRLQLSASAAWNTWGKGRTCHAKWTLEICFLDLASSHHTMWYRPGSETLCGLEVDAESWTWLTRCIENDLESIFTTGWRTYECCLWLVQLEIRTLTFRSRHYLAVLQTETRSCWSITGLYNRLLAKSNFMQAYLSTYRSFIPMHICLDSLLMQGQEKRDHLQICQTERIKSENSVC